MGFKSLVYVDHFFVTDLGRLGQGGNRSEPSSEMKKYCYGGIVRGG